MSHSTLISLGLLWTPCVGISRFPILLSPENFISFKFNSKAGTEWTVKESKDCLGRRRISS